MLYASELTRFKGEFNALVDADSDDLPDLVARLLAKAVERRLRRNLTRGYRSREMALTRVRGRIDILTTEAHQLLDRGEVFCRFHDLTIDTPRNRLVRRPGSDGAPRPDPGIGAPMPISGIQPRSNRCWRSTAFALCPGN